MLREVRRHPGTYVVDLLPRELDGPQALACHQSYMRTVEGTVVTIPNGAVVPQATTILRPASGNQGIVKLLQSNAL